MNIEEYLQDEEKCGYLVTKEEKKIRVIQMDIVRKIDEVCKKNNISYYAQSGTLLGAVRHEGYIPWDDDIDLVMFRSDYNRFCAIAPTEFTEPYFFQSAITDRGFYSNSVYVCNSNTTCISNNNPNNRWIKFNRGIRIGIQCLDSCDSSNIKKIDAIRKIMALNSKLCNISCGINRIKYTWIIRTILKLLCFNPEKVWIKTQNYLTKYDQKWNASEDAVIFLAWDKHTERIIWKKTAFRPQIELPFEYMTLPCPSGYDEILRTQYGDYMKYPPVEKRKPIHDALYDPDKPYKEYCSKEFGIKY